MTDTATDWVIPENPQAIAGVADVMSLACGKARGLSENLIVRCTMSSLCKSCQTKYDALDKRVLVNMVRGQERRYLHLFGIIKGARTSRQQSY